MLRKQHFVYVSSHALVEEAHQYCRRSSAGEEDSYADILLYLRTKISFARIRSYILCFQGQGHLSDAKLLMFQ